jgi:biotin transporter BioY
MYKIIVIGLFATPFILSVVIETLLRNRCWKKLSYWTPIWLSSIITLITTIVLYACLYFYIQDMLRLPKDNEGGMAYAILGGLIYFYGIIILESISILTISYIILLIKLKNNNKIGSQDD